MRHPTPDRGIAWYRARGVTLAVVGSTDQVRGARLIARIARPHFLGASEEGDPHDNVPVISPSINVLDVTGY